MLISMQFQKKTMELLGDIFFLHVFQIITMREIGPMEKISPFSGEYLCPFRRSFAAGFAACPEYARLMLIHVPDSTGSMVKRKKTVCTSTIT
jgi:hypothetical protein